MTWMEILNQSTALIENVLQETDALTLRGSIHNVVFRLESSVFVSCITANVDGNVISQ
jgi:hypothetical protein